MKRQIILPACLLLLWTLTAFVSCTGQKHKITATQTDGGIKLTCDGENKFIREKGNMPPKDSPITLIYSDEDTGEYTCMTKINEEYQEDGPSIFVKFRTCDNCVELDAASISGIVVGDVVATIVIGVAVYLIASQARTGPIPSHKKSSDRQHLVPNEMPSRASNDHYQPLKKKSGQKDTYDVLHNRRGP
ncbi:T-cell surface glycoprotein CD3 gamma chain-like [Thunnus albacares]|uniref:T-cell surface glycoprotein CD3 gamma chain-like n=1 Tax=Thunnus albacares TaxID=8236 RepID=UPI001CF675D5|nr:T-cell surface glycoprotein CD3 gamma chain-like [Thunnus albacares]XP_044210201.1 T-cell surface glycoprotein CD3 gamma chain-like [Thunnus albacares]